MNQSTTSSTKTKPQGTQAKQTQKNQLASAPVQESTLGLNEGEFAAHNRSMASQSLLLNRLHPAQRTATVQRMMKMHGNAHIGRIISRAQDKPSQLQRDENEPSQLQSALAQYGMTREALRSGNSTHAEGHSDPAARVSSSDPKSSMLQRLQGGQGIQREAEQQLDPIDNGPSKHAAGTFDPATNTYTIPTDHPNGFDTLYSIAKRFGITREEIVNVNPDMLTDGVETKVQNGWQLKIPSKTGTEEPSSEGEAEQQSAPVDNGSSKHAAGTFDSATSIYTIPTDHPNGFDTLYSIAIRFGVSEEEIAAANPDTLTKGTDSKVHNGWQLRIPSKTGTDASTITQEPPAPSSGDGELSGDTKSSKVIRVAWTVDDGPLPGTAPMKAALAPVDNATWYVVEARLGGGERYKKNIGLLKEIQKNGGEIALHDEVYWFTNGTIDSNMARLSKFKQKLENEEIYPKFVRPHGGMTSQLQNLLSSLGAKGKLSALSEQILEGNITSKQPSVRSAAAEFEKMKEYLSEMDVLLWGGQGDYKDIASLSWDGQADREVRKKKGEITSQKTNNTVTGKGGPKKEGGYEIQHGMLKNNFGNAIGQLQEGEAANFVILTHDQERQDSTVVEMVKNDMEQMASDAKIRIEYHTMSSLFQLTTGQDVKTLDVRY